MKEIIKEGLVNTFVLVLSSASIVFMLLFAIDAEVARQDRNLGINVKGCIFNVNCHK